MALKPSNLLKQATKVLSPRTSTPKFKRTSNLLTEKTESVCISPASRSPIVFSPATTRLARNLLDTSPNKSKTKKETEVLINFDISNLKQVFNDLKSNSLFEYSPLVIKNLLGKGSFGYVIRAVHKGKEVAVKIIRLRSNNAISSIYSEKNALKLSHPNIVEVYKVINDLEFGIVIMKYYKDCSSLQDFIDKNETKIMSDVKYRFLYQIVDALNYLHSLEIMHLDIKPSNVLIVGQVCKICDFGCSRITRLTRKSVNLRPNMLPGTLQYIAPELLQGESPTNKCDIYSFGILMWQLQHILEYYHVDEPDSFIYHVVKHNYRPESKITRRQISRKDYRYQLLYQECWHKEPTMRPTTTKIMESLKEIQNLL